MALVTSTKLNYVEAG